jgi:CYTH domain-containing protein
MIDGLKLTMTGAELRQRLSAKVRWHESRRDEFEKALTPSDDPDSMAAQLPDHIIEHMRDEHDSRADVLTLIHDHLQESETYLLGEADLRFAEMIPRETED